MNEMHLQQEISKCSLQTLIGSFQILKIYYKFDLLQLLEYKINPNYKKNLSTNQVYLRMKKVTKNAKTKKKQIQLQRLLLDAIPQTPIPAPYFTIPSPQPYRFPLGETMLQGIKLLEQYEPQDINQTINSRLGFGNVQKITKYNDTYCMLGKAGRGLIVGTQFMDINNVAAYSYGPNYLLISYNDLRLEVYSLDLKLIKQFKKFSTRALVYLKLLSIPKGYQNIIFISYDSREVVIHRLQKSMISKLSVKLSCVLLKSLSHPITQMCELPKLFKPYLQKDIQYRDCSLISIVSVNRIDVFRINHFRLNMDMFWEQVYHKQVQELGPSNVVWGETRIHAQSREIQGDKLVLVCSFANRVFFLALNQIEKFHSESQQVLNKLQWIESYPFTLKNSEVAFCQFLKKNQFILITDQNVVMIFNTKNFQIFQKPISSDQFEIFTQQFRPVLSSLTIQTIQVKSALASQTQQNKKLRQQIPQLIMQMRNTKRKPKTKTSNPWQQQTQNQDQSSEMEQSLRMSFLPSNQTKFKNIVSYVDRFCYQYPSSQIYYLTNNQNDNFSVYVYCDWKLITDLLKIQRKYQQAMLFLIAVHKKANKFDLNVNGKQHQIAAYAQQLAIQYVNKVIARLKYEKDVQQNADNIVNNDQHFKCFIKPIQFLCECQEFSFLFQVAQQKLISVLILQQLPYHKQYTNSRKLFFLSLIKFIQHGRIKYIPQSHLQLVLDYYLSIDRIDIIDRLAIYFDLQKIDTGTLVQCLLHNDLTVSLAHICIQGTETLFVTPFVKFWGVSANYKHLGQMENATVYAIRSLWYVKLCLQRNWALKQYSFQKYGKMISILSHHFLSQKIIIGMLQIRAQECLQTLNYYFNIENSLIVNQEMSLTLKGISSVSEWIVPRAQNNLLQLLLSAICVYIRKSQIPSYEVISNIFLSNLIIYRTVRFSQEKYYEIILALIDNYKKIKDIKYGLDDKLLEEFYQQYQQDFTTQEVDQVLASRYIIRIFTLIYYQNQQFLKTRLMSIYERSRLYNLMDLQAELCLINGQFVQAVDIYLRARKNLRIWIFEFLQNSFKKLILQKRKNDKKRLADILTQKIKSLVQLDSTKTKQLVDNYLPQIQQQLIYALSDNQYLQLQYLQQIINSSSSSVNTKLRLSTKSILQYVMLMSKIKSDQLLQSFKNNTYFPIDQCIKICQEYQVYDCLQYLYEKSGASIQAVKIAMKRIDRILRMRMHQSEQLLQENFTHYIKIKQILDHSIHLCTVTRRQQTWQSLLDSSIQLYNKYLTYQDFPQDQIQIFFYINGQIMQHLASNCEIEHTIDLLQNKYQNLNMGGKMTKAFITILANLSHSINIMYVAENMIQKTYQTLMRNDFYNKIQGVGGQETCRACGFGIQRRIKSKHFCCHHSFHNQCVIHQSPSLLCVYCLINQTDQFQHHINSINSAMHPKLTKINQLFIKFQSQSDEMSKRLEREDQQENSKKENNINLSNLEKKRQKMKGFDDMITDVDLGSRRVLTRLRMF